MTERREGMEEWSFGISTISWLPAEVTTIHEVAYSRGRAFALTDRGVFDVTGDIAKQAVLPSDMAWAELGAPIRTRTGLLARLLPWMA